MNRLSPSPIDRAGQLGALGYGLGFALLGLFFATIMVANSAIPSLPLGIAWIAASFIAGCLGGAGIGLGADPRQVWKYTLLAGAALALANTVSLFVERLGFTWYLLNMDHGAVSFGYSVLSALLVGPLTGLFLGLAQKGFQRGLVLAGTGLLAFVLGFVAFMMVALTLIQGEAGIHTGLGAHPHSTWVLILAGMGFMGLTGAVGGVILGAARSIHCGCRTCLSHKIEQQSFIRTSPKHAILLQGWRAFAKPELQDSRCASVYEYFGIVSPLVVPHLALRLKHSRTRV